MERQSAYIHPRKHALVAGAINSGGKPSPRAAWKHGVVGERGWEAGRNRPKTEINDIGSEPPHPDLVISQIQREENHLYTDPVFCIV